VSSRRAAQPSGIERASARASARAAPVDPADLQEVQTGIPIVVSGPSGVGKSSVLRRALARSDRLRFSVSHTTRPSRAGEVDGRDYWFVSGAEFQRLIERDCFLEWAVYQGNHYGTSRAAVDEPTAAGFDLLLEVEVQGARQLRERLPGAVFVFLLPPSFDSLESRLRGRHSDTPEAIRKRLEIARGEIREAGTYDYVIVNHEIERAASDLLQIIEVSRMVPSRVLRVWRARGDLE
jgi:guanylate kinase